MGGGNSSSSSSPSMIIGLSPRGRGKRNVKYLQALHGWSIPAWAGETGNCDLPIHISTVYPRVGGGNANLDGEIANAKGLSPRGRGKPALQAQRGFCAGSIPAWAGETMRIPPLRCAASVYPRVGGGNQK